MALQKSAESRLEKSPNSNTNYLKRWCSIRRRRVSRIVFKDFAIKNLGRTLIDKIKQFAFRLFYCPSKLGNFLFATRFDVSSVSWVEIKKFEVVGRVKSFWKQFRTSWLCSCDHRGPFCCLYLLIALLSVCIQLSCRLWVDLQRV